MTDAFRRYRVLWPDQYGLPRGRYLPSSAARHGTSFSSAVFMQGYDQNLYPVEVALRSSAVPDVQALCPLAEARPGWEPDTGVIVADLYYGQEPYPLSARHALRDAVASWSEIGLQPRVGMTITGYVMQHDTNDGWQPFHAPSSYLYATGAMADPSGLVHDIMATADNSAIALGSVTADFDSPQFEIGLPLDDPLVTADNLFLVKELARELAAERDLKITFLPKPFPDRAGNSLLVNLAFDDGNAENRLHDNESPDRLSSLARLAMGGIIRHHEALAAIAAPTVNSYKRLRSAEFVGLQASWGYDHRLATIRVPSGRGQATSLEYRLADASAHPHLLATALLHASRLGEKSRINPGKSLNDYRDGEEPDSVTAPTTLETAVKALAADGELAAAIGRSLTDNFCQLKDVEWQSFVDAEPRWPDKLDELSDWEADNYLPFH